MFNSGYRNRRATDGRGVIGTQTQYLQTISPAISVSSWSISGSDDTALDPAGGQTVLVNGSGFAVGVSATVGGTQIGAVTIVSSTQLSFTSPANAGGSYSLVVYNVDGSAGILVPGLVYSAVPTWTTAAGTIGSFYETTAISTAVVATADSALTYSLSSGSLPVGSTLYANGVITGTAPVDSSSTTYTFAVTATDAELQDTTRTFTLTVNVDVVTWVTPGTSATITLDGSAYSQALSATDAAGYAVSYTANTLPTGLTLSAGTISGTPTVDGNISSLLTATAATTNRSATNTVTWVVALSDTYFQYVALGMSANQSIETQSFVADNSTNNAQLTVFGDTRAQNFNPYQIGYYSYYFTGSSYLYLSNQIALGSGDWTIEFWFYTPNSSSATGQNIYEGRPNATNGAYPTIYTQSGTIRYYTQSADRITSGTITPNTWYHIAVVKSSGTTKMWLNGVQAGSNYTDGNTYLSGTTRPLIASYDGSQGMYTGYISNLRVSNIAVYTNTFTPSTTPLLATVNTSWLTGQSNRIVDASINNFTTTISGTVSVSAANPFATVYQAGTQYYSGSFNGSTDYLSLATSPTIELTGNFTIECWIYPTSIGTYNMVLGENNGASSDYFAIRSNNTLEFLIFGGATAAWSYTWAANTWYHVAVVRISNALTAYVNGVSLTQSSGTFSTSAACFSVGLLIGRYGNSSTPYSFTGYISNVRLVKGAGIYTGNFVPSTAPLSTTQSAGTNTAAITQPSYSVSFNGSSQYLSVAANSALGLGTGDFTIEYWCYPNSISGTPTLIDFRSSAGDTVISDYLSSGAPVIYINSTNAATSSQALSAGAWAHVAYTRSGTTLRIFVNGVQTASVTNSYNMGSSQPLRIANNIAGSAYFNGYISNLRITKGQALYTSAFTPSTSPLTTTSQSATAANVSLLTCQSTTIIDNSLNLFSITNTGTATVASPNPFATGTVSLLTVQSPTFVDSSYNSLAITAATTTVKPLAQSPFTPLYYSNYFNGTTDYLSTTVGLTSLDLTSSDFTVECWVYNTGAGAERYLFSQRGASSGWEFRINATNLCSFFYTGGSILTSTGTISGNIWTHLAVTRSGTTVRIFINGALDSSATFSNGTSAAASYGLYIGWTTTGSGGYMSGYISNARIVKGQALYTTTFTPSTTPLTLTSQGATAGNVSLLTCQSPYFIDVSNNSFAIAILGSPRIAGIAPFTQPGGYSATAVTTYGSGYFDGTGDYLTAPAQAALSFSTGDFTIECWAFYTAINADQGIIDCRSSGGILQSWVLNVKTGGVVDFIYSGSARLQTAGLFSINTWNHIAVTRASGTIRIFVNGVQGASVSYASAIDSNATNPNIGRAIDPAYTTGYISDLRVIKGTALYTSAFVPQFTAPLSAVTNTQFLSLQTRGAHNNSDFVDQSGFNNLVTKSGNATNGTFDPYGNNFSTYFNGSTYFSLSNGGTLYGAIAGSLITIEFWLMTTNIQAITAYVTGIFGQFPAIAQNSRYAIQTTGTSSTSTQTVSFYYTTGTGSGAICTTTATITQNTWNHIAVTIDATTAATSTVKIYINGTGQTFTSQNLSTHTADPGNTFQLGAANDGNQSLTGYLSNFRFTRGQLVYTGNFTPPTAPLTALQASGTNTAAITNGSYVKALMMQSNRFNDNSAYNYSPTVATGTPQVQKFSPFSTVTVPTYYSGYFDGTGDYLNIAAGNTALNLGTGDFTLECWIYATSSGTSAIVDNRNPDTANAGFDLDWLTPNKIRFSTSGTAFIDSATTVSTNTWYHLALTRSSNLFKLYINGTVDSNTYTGSSTQNFTNTNFRIGSGQNGAFSGYISNLRITKGQVLYTTNFTPSTTPLTTTSQGATAANVSLLTCQSNTFVDNSTNYFAITANGDAKPLAVSPFTPTASSPVSYTPTAFSGSMYFDGTGDYLTIPASANLSFGTGNFTIEAWAYPTSSGSYRRIFSQYTGAGATQVFLRQNNDNALMFYVISASSVIATITSSSLLVLNTWNHCAISRNGSSFTLYLNGVSVGTASSAGSLPDTSALTTYISTYDGTNEPWLGYLSDVRVTKGVALYTANFYPGATPATPTYTIGTATYSSNLLLSGATGGVIDYSRTVDLETVADAKVTPFGPYNGNYYSVSFNGSSYMTVPDSTNWQVNTDYTVEFWMYSTSFPTQYNNIFNQRDGTTSYWGMNYDTSLGWALFWTISGVETKITRNQNSPLSTWVHVAVTRSGTTGYMFLNGVQAGASFSWPALGDLASVMYIGVWPTITDYLAGYLSNFRIVRGTAVYTGNFTPSTTPLTAIANTQLLTCQSNKFVDNSSNAFTLTTSGTPKVATQNPFALNSGISYYFDGTGDYLSIPTSKPIELGSADWTFETWVFPVGVSSQQSILYLNANSSGYAAFNLQIQSGALNLWMSSTGSAWSLQQNTIGTITAGVWTYIAVTKSSTTMKVYINGTQAGTNYTVAQSLMTTYTLNQIGVYNTSSYLLNGNLTDLRLTLGYVRYTSNFTPPTAPYKTN